MKSFVTMLKQIYWTIKHPTERLLFGIAFVRNIPGNVGVIIRLRLLPRYFARCGNNLQVQEHVRFINIHNISIGNDVVLANGSFLQGAGEIVLGDDVLLGPDVKIWSTTHIFEDLNTPISQQGYEYKKVILGDGVWIAANSIVLPGVHLPAGCIVSAGSVVGIKKYPEYAILAGNPARVIGNRVKKDPPPESKDA